MNMPNAGAALMPKAQSATLHPAADREIGSGEPAGDFLLALAQMIAASLPTTPAESTANVGIQDEEQDSTTDSEASNLLPAAPFVWPFAGDASEHAMSLGNDGDDPLAMLGLPRRGESIVRDAVNVQASTSSLAQSDEEPTLEALSTENVSPMTTAEAMSHRPSADMAPHARPLQSHVGTQAWADELGSRVTMMVERGQHTASLRLSPEHLGPLEIRISTREDQVSVWFGAAHADTRAAIEHALPRLREMFEAQGMSLADAGVFHEAPKQQQPSWSPSNASSVEPNAAEAETEVVRLRLGLVDMYA